MNLIRTNIHYVLVIIITTTYFLQSNAFLKQPCLKPINTPKCIPDKTSLQQSSLVQKEIISPQTCKTIAAMTLISGPLGMFLDNYHGLFGVLKYAGDTKFSVTYNGSTVLQSALWVPVLFAAAGLAMSLLRLLLDEALETPTPAPSWPTVWYGISLFSAQYWLSGALEATHTAPALLHSSLAVTALGGYLLLDRTTAGVILGLATALAGPVTEMFLVNKLGLYEYVHADLWGVCSWIPWVYLLGGPAVGNLTRRLHSDLTL